MKLEFPSFASLRLPTFIIQQPSQPSSSILIIHAKYYVTRLLHASQHIFLDIQLRPIEYHDSFLSFFTPRRIFRGRFSRVHRINSRSEQREREIDLSSDLFPPPLLLSTLPAAPTIHLQLERIFSARALAHVTRVCVYIYIYIPRPSATSSRIEFQCGRDLSTSLSTSPVFSVFNSLILHPTFHSLHGKVFGLCFPIIPTDDKN